MAKRFIDVEEIYSHIREFFSIDKTENADICFAFIDFMNWLDEQPTADVVEVRHGEWIWTENGEADYEQYWVCSVCGEKSYIETKYCSDCGAKMDGGVTE
ncbi:MAG: hypothetical protein IIU77_03230 [Clostridia bacterium]|nr:hypothetical protein [Clostridia bacterium]